MRIVKRSRDDIDAARLRTTLAARRLPAEATIARHAVEDRDAWTAPDLTGAAKVFPPPTPGEVKALRIRLGMSQARFARCFGFTIDTVQQYEQGRRRPSGPAATLLRVIACEPEAVRRALAA
ncbi:MAG: helix-turn-helix domain-containing protein [Stellaceae bacterium]